MKKVILPILVFFVFLFSSTVISKAIDNPLSTSNNQFGIHIINENDLENAADLVNGNGGQWGYVTIVIPENDRNVFKWQRIFDKMRVLKLIPIIRIATSSVNGGWKAPTSENTNSWVEFLNSLNWVVKNRYIVLFNEPNHAKEWGGKISPEEYATVTRYIAERLRSASPDFFILPAGFDVAASNTKDSMDASDYWKKMYEQDNNIFKIFDGWTTHSYPNPNFSASVNKTGRLSIKSYDWEIDTLEKYGMKKNIPIFITETGWTQPVNSSSLNQTRVAQNFERAYTVIWKDPRIVAITPFILNYTQPPFDKFSWKKPAGADFYPQYEVIKNLPKVKGNPKQINDSKFIEESLPNKLIADSEYEFQVEFENKGQSIWSKEGNFTLKVDGDLVKKDVFIGDINPASPGQKTNIRLVFKTPDTPRSQKIVLVLEKNGIPFGQRVEKEVELVKPPSVTIQAKLWPSKMFTASDFKLSILDNKEEKLEIKDITIKDGFGVIGEIHDIVPEKRYTFTLSKPYFVKKSRITTLSKENTALNFGYLFPLDLTGDSKLNFEDIRKFFRF